MIALDTNVLVRVLVDDEPAQRRAARALLDRQDERFWVPVTVCLELAWVLGTQGWDNALIAARLREVLTLSNVMPQHPEAIYRALDWYGQGLDFADALHLALSSQAATFASFDERLARRAAALGLSPAVTHPARPGG